MQIPEPLTLLLVKDKLSHEQLPVILLTQILDLELPVLFHKNTIIIIYLLSNLSHSF